MTDHAEEQEMEAEALTAIFESHFHILRSEPPLQWSVELYPQTGDPSEMDVLNHVACKLVATLPSEYPDSALPELDIEIIKGLAEEHRQELRDVALEEARVNEGVPSIFAVAERIREWLLENNVKGLDDLSMHAQMMRKKKEEEKAQQRAQQIYESQKTVDEMTEAEKVDLEVRKRRAEGTPCTLENFMVWKERFERELEEKKASDMDDGEDRGAKKRDKPKDDKSGRLTGYQYFSSKANNLEALEAAAEAAENDETPIEELEDVNEELFDEDVDLDDLEFDDDDDDDDDEDEDEEVDI